MNLEVRYQINSHVVKALLDTINDFWYLKSWYKSSTNSCKGFTHDS